MAIRIPLKTVLDTTHTNQGTTSVAGGWAYAFQLPQDTDGVVVKMTASVTAGGISAFFQTSDDGGTTYFDCARTSIVSANAVGASPQFLYIPVVGNGQRTAVTQSASILTAGIGGPGASTLGSQQTSGLPILGIQNRVFLMSTGNATAISARVQVMANSQSATA